MSAYLVVGPSWVGDMVMAHSLVRSLRQRNPGAPVDVIAPAWSAPVAQRMDDVREAIVLPVSHRQLGWTRRRALGKTLRDRRYSQAFVLPNSMKSALVPWFANVPLRTGYRGEWRYGLLNDLREKDPRKTIPPARRWLALGYRADAELPPVTPPPRLHPDAGNRDRIVQLLGLRSSAPVVALVPGGEHGSSKRWPVEYFGELARALAKQGIAVWVLGSSREMPLGHSIATEGGKAVVNLCGRTMLPDVIDLLGSAAGVVCNDSGLMHVAAALGVFVVALYGPTTPTFTPPMTDNCRVLYLDLPCSPCYSGACPLEHHNCLRQISPGAVLEALLPAIPFGPGAVSA
jgi:heptosyltransferase II